MPSRGVIPSGLAALSFTVLSVITFSAFVSLAGNDVTADEADTVRAVEHRVPDCNPACSSHVIASPVPGVPALVVSGASAFGLALESGPMLDLLTVPGRSVDGGAGPVLETEVEPARPSGGFAIAGLPDTIRIDHRLSRP